MIAEKNAQASLNGLQPNIDSSQTLLSDVASPSRVADWRLWLWLFSFGVYVLEGLWDLFRSELDEVINNAPVGTTRWYQQECFKFQLGDTLIWLNNKYQYATVDTLTQIIKRAAVVENSGQVTIKIAKLVSGVITPLSVTEKAAFTQYINLIKIAGTQTVIITDVPDLLKIAYTIYYDPLVLANDGSLISNPSVFPAEDAVNAYVSNLDFNGDMILTKLTDAIQTATGVVNPILQTASAKYGANPYSNVIIKYNANAGHMKIDPAFPLSTQFTYLPNV